MKLEISYTYTEDKHTPPQNSWTYFNSKFDDLDKATKEADKHFVKFARERGWTKQVQLKSILRLNNETTPLIVRVVVEPKSPTKRRKRTQQKSPTQSQSRPRAQSQSRSRKKT